jgi:16S rRNA (guanine1516-N2)-methyltransferase
MKKTLMLKSLIAVHPTTPDAEKTAEILAQKLSLPLINIVNSDYPYLLIVSTKDVGLQKQGGASQAIYVDFSTQKWQLRLKQLSFKKEALIRALGLKNNTYPKIIDATGGLIKDSFIIASLGFEVTALERSPIICTLIEDGMKRTLNHSTLHKIATRLHIIQCDAIQWLTQLKNPEKPDIIYLDPMFPERKKSALPKKEMLIFHDIVGDDHDANDLLITALACATKRVVVKRPKLSNPLKASCLPSFSLTGSSSRFDIYLI